MPDKTLCDGVRRTTIAATIDQPENQFHIISNLNWLRYERHLDLVLRALPDKGRLLDAGCGWGLTTAIIAASRPGLQVIGLDIAEMKSWEPLKKFGATYQSYDARTCPFEDSTFDYCLTFGVIEHTEDEVKFLQEINRVLKPGGCLFVFNLPSKYAVFERLANLVGIKSHDRTYTAPKIRALMKSTGFIIESIKRELFLPAQVARISKSVADVYNRYYLQVDKMDLWLTRPLNYFAQSYAFVARKS
ncbi:MAG: methyltransferase domain-containing protein [Chloroflexi bacterium]|nr:methyltransferase domain-containing protein [Chloroflexota bacterium]